MSENIRLAITVSYGALGILAYLGGRYGASVKDWFAAKWNNAMISLGQ